MRTVSRDTLSPYSIATFLLLIDFFGQIFTFHFHRYSKQAHLAIKKLAKDSTKIPPKNATKPVPPMVGSSSPPTGIQINVLVSRH
jgi:hypothetical protein